MESGAMAGTLGYAWGREAGEGESMRVRERGEDMGERNGGRGLSPRPRRGGSDDLLAGIDGGGSARHLLAAPEEDDDSGGGPASVGPPAEKREGRSWARFGPGEEKK
jgi:hypothetical protein